MSRELRADARLGAIKATAELTAKLTETSLSVRELQTVQEIILYFTSALDEAAPANVACSRLESVAIDVNALKALIAGRGKA